jgi:hypothetical protein
VLSPKDLSTADGHCAPMGARSRPPGDRCETASNDRD